MRITQLAIATVALFTAPWVSCLSAAPIVYLGFDPGAASSDQRPNAAGAASSFQSALSSYKRGGANLESRPVGAFSNLNEQIAPDFLYQWHYWPTVALSGADNANTNQTIRNSPAGTPEAEFGYNTTGSGAKFISLAGGNLVLSFSRPFEAFGAYFTGLQGATGMEGTITFDDGSTQTISLPGHPSGGVAFVGFINAGRPFTQLTITTGNGGSDAIGVDDIRVAGPEPHYTAFTYRGFITSVQRNSGSYIPAKIGDKFTATLNVIDNIVPRDGDPRPGVGRFVIESERLGTLALNIPNGYGDMVFGDFFSMGTSSSGFNAGGEGGLSRLLSLSATPPGFTLGPGDWTTNYSSGPATPARVDARDMQGQWSFHGIAGQPVAFIIRTHGPPGIMSIYLPFTGAPAIESRSGGSNGNHTINVGFPDAVSGSASVVSGTGQVFSNPQFSGNVAQVILTGVANAQTLTLALTNLRSSSGAALPDVTVQIGFLLGDLNGDRSVNSADAMLVRARSGQPVDTLNARFDVNFDGAINSADATLVRSFSGTGLP